MASIDHREPPRFAGMPRETAGAGREIAVAVTRRDRARGMARLDTMPSRLALRLPRCRSIHTFGMRFALDLVWLDRGGRVVRVDESVNPGRMRTCLRAWSVIETAAGEGRGFAASYKRGPGGA